MTPTYDHNIFQKAIHASPTAHDKPKDTNLFTQISYKIATKCEKENKDNTFDTDQLSLNILNSKP